MARPVPPSADAICDFWDGQSPEFCVFNDCCWACWGRETLERCHIVPYAKGGSNEPGNFVLLCRRCHRNAPDTGNLQFMKVWIEKRYREHINRCKRISDRAAEMLSPEQLAAINRCVGLDELHEAISEAIKQLDPIMPFGVGGWTDGSWVAIYQRAAEILMDAGK